MEPQTLLQLLSPEGWHRSQLSLAFHPSAEQIAEERERIRRKLDELQRAMGSAADPLDAADVEDLQGSDAGEGHGALEAAEVTPRPIEPEREVVELVGYALWDVFSDNHTVVDAEETAYHLGSFRGSADFIADSINRRYPDIPRPYDYMDFYMGSWWVGQRADLRSVYRWIFEGLKERGCRWIYSFPRIYLFDFGGREQDEDPLRYDPGEAVRAELERAARAEQTEALAAELESGYREDVRRARTAPLPATVAAYREVFGSLPEGWPHPDM